MTYFNEYDIDNALRQFDGDPILGPAVRTLSNLKDWTDNNSDGWAYWQKPSRASARLQELIQRAVQNNREVRLNGNELIVSADDVRKAYTPIKAFLTRQIRAGQVVTPGIVEDIPVGTRAKARAVTVDEAFGDLAAKAWAKHPNNPDRVRRAKVAFGRPDDSNGFIQLRNRVSQYLPSNYAVEVVGNELFIVGHDSAGWTLDGYVIPRLASGLIFAEEVAV